jgi:hypothetical protein
VAVAADDVAYRNHPDRDKLEARLMAEIFRGQQHGLHQGIYVVTSSGRFLARANTGWPDPDPDQCLRILRQAHAAYRQLPQGQRVLQSALDPQRDRLVWERDGVRRPEGMLDLRVVKRGYAFPGMTSFDIRHPMYYSLDRLWYRREEYLAWVPTERRVGASVSVRGPALERLILHNHLMIDQAPWNGGEIRQAAMTSTITGITGSRVSLKITGDFDLQAGTQYNRGAYRGSLLGRAVFDVGSRTFTEFELLSLGTDTVAPMLPNMHAGSPVSQVGSLITLNPQGKDEDDLLLPSRWHYGYARQWAAR